MIRCLSGYVPVGPFFFARSSCALRHQMDLRGRSRLGKGGGRPSGWQTILGTERYVKDACRA